MRERGLKLLKHDLLYVRHQSRSREGAWIEMAVILFIVQDFMVAPVRERGLKLNRERYTTYVVNVAPVRERGLK